LLDKVYRVLPILEEKVVRETKNIQCKFLR